MYNIINDAIERMNENPHLRDLDYNTKLYILEEEEQRMRYEDEEDNYDNYDGGYEEEDNYDNYDGGYEEEDYY